MALTQAQKIAVRRHLNIPFAGTAQAGRLFGWRFEDHVEDVEYRMNNMQPSEEALLTGACIGSYRIDGIPTVGDTLTFTLTGVGASTYTVLASDVSKVTATNGSPTFQIALNAAAQFNATYATSGYQAVAVQPADLFTAPMFTSYFAELIIVSPSSTPFTLAASRTGTTNCVVDSPGVVCPVTATIGTTTVYGYIQLLDTLAMQMAQASLSLTYTTADVVTFRPDEVRARRGLYHEYRAQMAELMGGRAYINRINRGAGSGAGATA